MPLLDHFEIPLDPRRAWESFHSRWANSIADQLNEVRNKACPDSRSAFVAKTAAYLQRGIGLIILDIITGRRFKLHNELVRTLGLDSSFSMPDDALLYAVAYRPVRRGRPDQIDAWPLELSLGASLPVLPLALRGVHAVPVDLNAAYEDACHRSRL
jgi:hypothetical protein